MKTIKFFLCFFIFIVGVIIIGESQTFRLNNFYSPYHYTTLYLQYGQSEDDLINDTLRAAKQSNVEVFTFIKTAKGSQSEITIYGSPGAEKHINEKSSIYSKKYSSLFLEDIQFNFRSLESIQGIKDIHDFYVIGDFQQADQFKTKLIDTYAGNFPQEGYVNHDTRNTIISIWMLMIGITLLLTYYDVIYQKKENMIRISMGESNKSIILKNIALDSFIFSFMFFIIFLSFRHVTSVLVDISLSLVLLFVLLILNAIIYINLRSYKIKEVFSNSKSYSLKLLSVNYGLKIVTIMITIFTISSNIVLITESYNLYKQKPFFEDYSNYSYITMFYRPALNEHGDGDPKFEESEQLQADFYTKYFSQSNATLVSMIHQPLSTTRPTIMANKNAFSYLERNIDELKQLERTKEVYLILPKSLSKNSQILTSLKNEFRFFEGNHDNNNFGVIYYTDHIELTAINANHIYGSEQFVNPIIIYNNRSPEEQPLDYEFSRSNYISEIMYDIQDEEFQQFIQEHQLTDANAVIAKTNVLDKFNDSWNIAKKTLYLNLVFSLLVIFLEFLIIISIIKLEYEVHAIELSVKKVLGHSILQKNKKIILMTFITSLLSIGFALLASLLLDLNSAGSLILGGLLISSLEFVIIFSYIRKIEKQSIQKILKGGNV